VIWNLERRHFTLMMLVGPLARNLTGLRGVSNFEPDLETTSKTPQQNGVRRFLEEVRPS
jgi:hypothetical protein